MFSLANIFGSAQPAPAPAQQPVQQAGQPGNIPSNAGQTTASASGAGTAPNGTVPANTPPANNEPPKSGLDAFADIWQPSANAAQQGQPLFNVSQEKMMEAARKQNFVGEINPELAAKVAQGGPEAVAAIGQIINMATQAAYAQSAFAGTKLIEAALDKGGYAKTSDVDSRFKNLSVDNSLRSENPIFSHPAAQPMLDSVKQQLIQKHPNATPSEITALAQNYLTSFVAAFQQPQQQQQQQQQAQVAGKDDWSQFLA